jgi:predicted DNA-binding protein YlxM (UPF0122 family)
VYTLGVVIKKLQDMVKQKAKRTEKQNLIIKAYMKVKMVHPSYQEIADQVGVSKKYAYDVIQKHIEQNGIFGIK